MNDLTPVSALLGGVLIGLASVWLLAANGRIAGVSGIVHGLVNPLPNDALWRVCFIGGLLLAGVFWQALWQAPWQGLWQALWQGLWQALWQGHAGNFAPRPGFSLWWVAAAGLCAGFGTRMAAGCTSGHGICGLGRLSVRSLVAVVVFVATAILTTFIMRHLLGVPS